MDNQPGQLNNLRVRSAIGWAGSQPGIVNAYSQYITYAQLPFAGRPGFVNDITYGNPELKNERAREWEVGAELGVARTGASASRRRTTTALVSDLLFFRPLPSSTGFSRQFAPIGTMSNKGFELLLNTHERRSRRISPGRRRSRTRATRTTSRTSTIQDFQSAGGYPNRIRAG